MNAPILNREFQHPADGWYQIEPLGEHPNAPANVVQVIDVEAARSIVNRFNTSADAGTLSHGAEMLVDHEHFSHDVDKETRAFGWLNRLDARADGIYGRIRWSTTGKAAVDGGDYRFFSTEYNPEQCAILNAVGSAGARNPARDGARLPGSDPWRSPGSPSPTARTTAAGNPSPIDFRRKNRTRPLGKRTKPNQKKPP